MFRPVTALRVHVSSISLLNTPLQRQCSFSLDVQTAKARVADWEPALRFPSHPHHNESQDVEDNTPWMTTYSASDPGMLRPLLTSGIALGVEMFTSNPPQPKAIIKAETQAPVTAITKSFKPWLYVLPKSLQPTADTTFEMLHGTGTAAAGTRHVCVLQAVLYGISDSETKFSFKKGTVYEVGMLHKVLYGGKEVDVEVVAKSGGKECKALTIAEIETEEEGCFLVGC